MLFSPLFFPKLRFSVRVPGQKGTALLGAKERLWSRMGRGAKGGRFPRGGKPREKKEPIRAIPNWIGFSFGSVRFGFFSFFIVWGVWGWIFWGVGFWVIGSLTHTHTHTEAHQHTLTGQGGRELAQRPPFFPHIKICASIGFDWTNPSGRRREPGREKERKKGRRKRAAGCAVGANGELLTFRT